MRHSTTGFFYGPVEEEHVDENGNTWYYVWDNWLPARYYHIVEASTFTGVAVNVQPRRPFGWVRYDALALLTVRERPAAVGSGEYWVDVGLSQQTIAAYEGDRMVYAALISSGLSEWSMRVGLNQVWERRLSAPMEGGGRGVDYYYIDGVLHTLYFDGEISLHNAFWHDDFGRPKSHGCVNLAPRVAEWIYYWSAEGPNDLWVWSHYSNHAEFTD